MPPWYQKAIQLQGQPVGVSLANGQGISGLLCSISGGTVVIQEYLYQNQFAAKQYPFAAIQDINPFPGCYVPSPVY
ncbi:hypothetical protein [Paenibacillus agilis]|uniref:Uncharacterized protein n=1 Tax=Paenibacillus agilis TaxID=3020863 RepID=A0A559IGS0_9BACL|nr:hypothetical protein [Paenibacillus agilis]TVX86852.1 hypothetical protein FPZ44_23350 [Paenibacillus agilis]